MEAVGICHSDYHVITGDTVHLLPTVLGHEGFGTVFELGLGVKNLKYGDKVALSWAPACGQCYYCLHNSPALCKKFKAPIWNGTMQDGSPRFFDSAGSIFHYCGLGCFSEFIVAPIEACIPMPSNLPAEIGALIGCAVTTGVGSVLNTAKVTPGSSIVVIGCGGVGLSTIMGAKYAGAETILAIDRLPARLQAALDCGATAHATIENALTTVQDLTENRGADYVFEAVGRPELQASAIELARPGGKVIFSGLSPMNATFPLNGSMITREEKTIMGSYYGSATPSRDFMAYAELFQSGKLPLDRLITHRYSLSGINIAFRDMLEGVSRRGVVVF